MFSRLVRPILFFLLVIILVMTAWALRGGGGQGHGGGGQGHGSGMAAAPPAPEAIHVPAKGARVPMQDFGGRAVVDVKINGRGPYRFVLSTTATMTIIDSALDKDLQLPAAEGVQAAPSGGNTPVIVTIGELRMGDAVVRGFMGAVMPLGHYLSGENAPRGIVSAAIFQGHLLTYDYPKKRVSIEKGKLEKTDGQSIFDYTETRPTLPIKIGDLVTRVQLDTGSGAGLTLPTKFGSELPLTSPPKEAGKTRTNAGEFAVSKAQVNAAIELGKYKLVLSEVSFSDVRSGAGISPGNIGYEVLRNFVVTLDTWNRRIRLLQ